MVVIFSILLGLLVLRLLLPYVALYFINRKLAKLQGYHGDIGKININLLRGSYVIHHIVVYQADSNTTSGQPFFTAPKIDLLVQWKALFKKSFIGTVVVDQPELNFHKEAEPKADTKNPSSLKTLLQQTLPFNINFGVKGGTINYIDHISKASVDLALTNLAVCVRQFSNMPTLVSVPANITASAHVYEGTFDFTMKLFPMAEHLTFDMNAEVKDINMVLLNAFFRAYAKIDINRGTFEMFIEVAAKDGGFTGYVKPVIKDLDIVGVEDKNDSLFRKLWERAVAGAYQIIKNKKEDQVAAKIPIEGQFDDPHINIFVAVMSILKNAFIRAIHPSIDDVINITNVRKSFSKVTGFVKSIFRRNEEEVM